MIKIALAGQPNCGKSTIFNMLSGAKQHIANYPGVTVDKKSSAFNYENQKIELVDLPGTYSFSSYSLEERVAKDFIIDEKPDLILNIVDASNIKRNLYLTFQLLEMGIPVIIVLNMMDVAKRRALEIDSEMMSKMLGVPVIEASGAKNIGKKEILDTIIESNRLRENYQEFKINYEELEPHIKAVEDTINIENSSITARWYAIKALEGDTHILDRVKKKDAAFSNHIVEKQNELFHKTYDKDANAFLATFRYDSADVIFHKAIKETKKGEQTITDKADSIVLNRWLSFPVLGLVIFLIYELSIVFGYKLTDYTWPLLAAMKNAIVDIMPVADIIQVPLLTDFTIWMVNSANALLNYIPIFFILFALIAIMEDVGYMPRIAFLLDKIFRKYGLHGQSTLPLVLGGAFVGGCAVPGVMATKGIADERARMATILSVPLMNCLAKVPFYTLLLGAFFKPDMALMMFMISTVTIFNALILAKLVTGTFLKNRETAPFIMELPPYHMPTLKGVLIRAFERVWLYIKKVMTIVLAVAIILFAMLQFPGVSSEKEQELVQKETAALVKFDTTVKKSEYYAQVDTREEISSLLNYYDSYKAKKMNAKGKEAGLKINETFKEKNGQFYKFVKPGKDKEAKKINKALRKLSKNRNRILREMKNEKINNSFLGMAGRAMESVTKYAGFDWRINVAFLSSFAARESAVATLGSLYENNKADDQRAEEAMAENSGYSPLHAAAMIIFMLLTPPCIATMIVVKIQTNSYKWMMFSIFFPITIGLIVSSIVFSAGSIYGWSGFDAMLYYYLIVVGFALILGFFNPKRINWKGGYIQPKSKSIYIFNQNKKENKS